MKIISVLFIILNFSLTITAQQKYLKGNILDSKSHQAVPYCSLKINDKQIGTVTNAEGQFILMLAGINDNDSIKVSCIGYKTISRKVAALAADQKISIYLDPEAFTLNEVVIQPQSVTALLKEAIETTDALIPKEDKVNAYYKEFAFLDQKLFKYADAAVDYDIDNKDKKTKAEMYVIESRVKKDSVTEENKWRSDVESLIKPDKVIKDYYSLKYLFKFISPKQIEKYNYKIETLGELSKISIDPKTEVHQYLPNAVVYINADQRRVIKVEYGYHSHLKYAPNINMIFIAYAVEKENMMALYSDGAHPFLRYCRLAQDIRFKVGGKKGLLGSLAEVLVHDNALLKQPVNTQTTSVYKKGNLYQNGNKFSEDFWYKYNTILPTAEEMKDLH